MILRWGILLLFYIITSAIITLTFFVRPGVHQYHRATFPDMLSGTAHKPYVYRQLVPATIRAISSTTPDAFKKAVATWFARKHEELMKLFEWSETHTYEHLLSLIISFFCFLGLAFVLRSAIALFYDFPRFVADVAPILGLVVLPAFFRYINYVYDPVTLLLTAAAIVTVYRRLHWSYYCLFVIATLNKETSILLIGLFILRELKLLSKPLLVMHVLFQLVLWTSARIFYHTMFAANPGSTVEFHLFDHNLNLLFRPGPMVYLCVASAIVLTLVLHQWGKKPKFLRSGLVVTVTPILVLAVFFSYLDELRIYYEAYPFLFLLSLPTIVHALGIPPKKETVSSRSSVE